MNRIDGKNAIILAYHHVCDFWHPTIARVSTKSFKSQLNYLSAEGFRTSTLSEYFSNPQEDQKKKTLLLTFDDALSCFYQNSSSLLLKRGMKATVFVVTNFVGKKGSWDYYDYSGKCRHLTWKELKELNESGFEIGSHSCNHIDLKSASSRKIIHELETSKKMLEERLSVTVNFFSYPFGRFSQKIQEYCMKAGYLGAVTMYPGLVNGNYYGLNRKAVYLFEGQKQFRRKVNYVGSGMENLKLKTINSFSIGTIILNNIKQPSKTT